jgi:uncharacterized protein (DUF885 family)
MARGQLDILALSLPGIIGLTGRYSLIEIERNIKKKAPAVLPVYSEYLPKLHLEIAPLPSTAEVAMHSGIITDKARIRKAIPCKIMNPSELLEELAVLLTSTH